jgi:hypothetical protein
LKSLKQKLNSDAGKAMTDKELASFKEFVRQYTVENTKTKKTARKTLMQEGLYDTKGHLKAEFGGKGKKAKAA